MQISRLSPGPFASTLVAVLALTFVLPSCFTFAVWREGNRPKGGMTSGAVGGVENPDAPRLRCRLEATGAVEPWDAARAQRALTVITGLWQPPLQPGTWLEIEPTEHQAEVVRLWREQPDLCGLQFVAGADGASPRCWFVCPHSPFARLPDEYVELPGVRTRSNFATKKLVFEAECRIAPAAAPAGALDAQIAAAHCEPPTGTATRVLMTPLTLAIDGVLLPLELLAIGAWW